MSIAIPVTSAMLTGSKAVYLLGSGWQVSQVAQALMIDRESVRNHHKRYRKGGLLIALLRNDAGGSESALN